MTDCSTSSTLELFTSLGSEKESMAQMDTDKPINTDSSTLDSIIPQPKVSESVKNTSENTDFIRYTMLDRVANSDGHFKHQQRDEPDLTFEEKRVIAAELLVAKPSVFLNRYSKFLTVDDIPYFSSMRNDYIIDFHMKEIEKQCDDNKSKMKVRNRRYEAMKKLMDDGNYFSDEEMKSRDPLLYQQMVGQFESEEEIQAKVESNKGDLRLSTILEKHIDVVKNNLIYNLQKEYEDMEMMEDLGKKENIEEDESEESELEDDEEEVPKISHMEKMMLRNEFLRTMQHRFLSGEDDDFNYKEVDENVEYDSLDILGRDMEEKYFDEEDPETIHSEASSGQVEGQVIIDKNIIENMDVLESNS